MQLTPEMLDRAEFPSVLRDLLATGKLELYHADDEDGTLCFQIPGKAETRSDVTLYWHGPDPGTWTHEGMRFYVERTHYHDRDCTSVSGAELLDPCDDEDIDGLAEWISRD